MASARPNRTIRVTLLLLLWAWAACVFVIVDLFFEVEAFDRVRPDSRLYEGMRIAAHRMIGEPIDDPVRPTSVHVSAARHLAQAMDEVRRERDPDQLAARARDATDPRVRIAALRELAMRRECGALLAAVHDRAEVVKVRRDAARLLGVAGAEADLQRLLDSDLPDAVKDGAVLGLGEAGTEPAAECLLALSLDRKSPRRAAAIRALAQVSNPAAGPILRAALLDSERSTEARVALCRALARFEDAANVHTLSAVLADRSAPATVRTVAADSLGRLGDPRVLSVVVTAQDDPDPTIAQQARLTASRLTHAR